MATAASSAYESWVCFMGLGEAGDKCLPWVHARTRLGPGRVMSSQVIVSEPLTLLRLCCLLGRGHLIGESSGFDMLRFELPQI